MPTIVSVGIDIGTSTTQVIFSRITMDNTAGYFTAPRISIVGKEVFYRSEVRFTPLKTAVLIDGDAVRGIVEEEFRRAGMKPENVDTGAVIITGESARKENAAEVLEKLSDLAGEFVVSTAGPDLESIIAGKGSGAYQYSIDNDCAVANLDVGGGTTNIVWFRGGDTVGKCCCDVGGRLVRLKKDGTVESVSEAAKRVADEQGLSLRVGERADEQTLARLTARMAELLSEALGLVPETPLLRAVQTPNSSPPPACGKVSRVCFSGGVADCMEASRAGTADFLRFGDIGMYLGRALRENAALSALRRVTASETIRATVVGAGTYTTSLSGSTISYSPGVFPLKNVPALKLSYQEQQAFLDAGPDALYERCRWFLAQNDAERMLLAIPGKLDPTYQEVKRMAKCIVGAMDRALPAGEPVVTVVEQDIAKALGNAMKQETNGRRAVAAIDSIRVEAGDFVDIGRPLMDGLVVPVVVKTLLFG